MKAKHARTKPSYFFLILLIFSCIVAIVVSATYLNREDDSASTTPSTTITTVTTTTTATTTTTTASTTTSSTMDGSTEDTGSTTVVGSTTVAESTTVAGSTTVVGSTTAGSTTVVESATTTTAATASGSTSSSVTTGADLTTTTLPTTTQGPTTTTTISPTAGNAEFPNTLFIGDSRTEGLRMYGRITGADFFSKTSMSSFTVMKETIDVKGVGKTKLEPLLKGKQYSTVYVMLGINEIGYTLRNIVAKYEDIIALIKSTQPHAKIVIQSTLHVRADKEKGSITNANINKLNEKLEALADNTTVFFLNVNPVFDDKNGAMAKEYSNDGVHFTSRCYPLWTSFLANNRI